jgi:hypothetical protein
MSKKNILTLVLLIGSLAGTAPAATLWFSQKAGAGSGSAVAGDLILNNGRVITNLSASGLSCIRTNAGDDLLYSIVWVSNDFNGDGTNDTLSFDLRVEGFTNSTYTYSTNAGQSSMTALGASSDVTAISNTWGVGGDYDVDAGQSLRFSVTNVQVSAPGCVGTFGGFTGVKVIESNGGHDHLLILGEGTGLDSKNFSTPDATYTFPAVDRFVVTGAGSFYEFAQWAVASMDFKFSVSNPTNPAVWDVTDYSEFVTGPGYRDEYPAQQSFSNYPAFSWDTVPRWLIIRKRTAYTAADINSMATNYQLIVFEKANQAGFSTIEEGILDTAARVRAVNPATKNIFYWNAWIHYGGYAANALYEPHAWEWSNHTTDSNGTEIIYMFKDLYYTHNYAVPEMRDWWVNTALSMAGNSAIDGVFIDKIGELDTGVFIDGVPASDYLKMMVALEQGLPEGKLNLGNTLRNERNNGARDFMEIEDGSYLERWNLPDPGSTPAQSTADSIAVSIQLMREALAKGKIILFKTSSPDEYAAATQSNMSAHVEYPLAIFLIVAETNGYFAYQAGVDATYPSWNWDASWMPEFRRPLGKPLGDSVRNGYVYTRSYEHVDVRVDISTGESLLAWDSVDSDGDGMPDLWEYRNFGGTTNAVASANPDGDAYNNQQEYIAGLNPNVFDTFAVSNFTVGANNSFKWNAASGRFYNVYWSSNLLNGFTLLGSNAPGGAFIDTNHAGAPKGFYKITVGLE